MSETPQNIPQPPVEGAARSRRRWPMLLFGGLAVVIISGSSAVVWLLALGERSQREVEALTERIREKGEPLTADEMAAWYKSFAPVQAAPALEELIAQLRERDDEERIALDAWQALHESYPNTPIPPEELDELRALLEPFEGILSALPAAAAHEHAGFPLDFEDGMEIALPNLAPMRAFMRLLAMQAELDAARSAFDEADHRLALGFRMGRFAEETPTIIGGLVGIAVRAIGAHSLERIFSRHSLPPDAFPLVGQELATVDPAANFRHAIIGERAVTHITLLGLYHDPANPVLASNIAPMLREYTRIVDGAKLDVPIESWDFGPPPDLTIVAVLPGITLPAMRRSLMAFHRDAAGIRSVQIALAVEEYRLDHGELPDTLDALLGDYLDAIPSDPFDGEPMRYRVLEDGYVVYSVYINREDNGGEKAESHGEDAFGDWPFRVLRTEK